MGQQQLLLLVVGIIIVAVAVVVGINQFGDAANSGTMDAVVQAQQHIGTMALAFAGKPLSYGGGDGSTIGYSPSGALLNVSDQTIAWDDEAGTLITIGTGGLTGKTITTTVTPGGSPGVATIIGPSS